MRTIKTPIVRILHVLGGMNIGGVETWLMETLRYLDRDRFKFDFLIHTDKKCAYDDELLKMGCKLLPCLHPSRPWQYANKFFSILRNNGPYDVVHSHVHHYSGYVLLLAKIAGVPMRIAHSHSDTSYYKYKSNVLRRIYLSIMYQCIRKQATLGLSCSRKAEQALFGLEQQAEFKKEILYCGIDLTPFNNPVMCSEIRTELGIPYDVLVVGHVGRFEKPKNHAFILDILACIEKQAVEVRGVCVGDGSMRAAMENKADRLGLKKHIIFTGALQNIPRIMLNCMDIFLLPSLYEGLGRVLVEAQAAGLPCVISDVIPEEADLIPELVTRLPLTLSPEIWAQQIIQIIKNKKNIQANSFVRIRQSSFNLQKSISRLCEIYSRPH